MHKGTEKEVNEHPFKHKRYDLVKFFIFVHFRIALRTCSRKSFASNAFFLLTRDSFIFI